MWNWKRPAARVVEVLLAQPVPQADQDRDRGHARELVPPPAPVDGLGCPTALVTNTGRALTEAALDSIGREHFTVSVCADEVPRGKPDPDPYQRAAELLGVPPRRCLAVEDSPNGVAAAEAAGCLVVAVPSVLPIPTRPGRVVASSLAQLDLAMLRGMMGGR